MSYTEIYKFNKEGDAELYGEVRNSFRSAIAIWYILEDKYLPKKEFSRFALHQMQDIWDLAKPGKLEYHERIVLMSTFDDVVVAKKNIQEVIGAFSTFNKENPERTNLSNQSDILRLALKDDEVVGVGWNQTSVGNGWDSKVKVGGELTAYNVFSMNDHWEMFGNDLLKLNK